MEVAFPNRVTLAGYCLEFGPFIPGERPACNFDVHAELAAVALAGKTSRLLHLSHAVRTGVEAGLIRVEHLDMIGIAVGGVDPVDAEAEDGPERPMAELIAPHPRGEADAIAIAWVFGHEPCHGGRVEWSEGWHSLLESEYLLLYTRSVSATDALSVDDLSLDWW